MVRGVFVRGFCLEGFVWGSFCPFPLLSEYLRFNRKLNITLNLRFHMYDKIFLKYDVTCTCSWITLPCHKLSHFLGPPPPRASRTLWTAPMHQTRNQACNHAVFLN